MDQQAQLDKLISQEHRIFGLDLIRALAVSFVFIAHLVFPLQPLGVLGVEIFFILSGYLVGGIFLDEFVAARHYSFKHLLVFWKRRWWRTLPNYYLFLIIYGVVAYSNRGELPGIKTLLEHLFFAQNLLWPMRGFFVVSWSLTIEEWFYLILPLVVLSTAFFKLSKKQSFVIGCLVMASFSIIIRLTIGSHGPWDYNMRQIALGRLDALAAGCLLAYLARYHGGLSRILKSKPVYLAGLVLLGITIGDLFQANYRSASTVDSDYFYLTGFGITVCLTLGITLIFMKVSQIHLAWLPFKSLVTNISKWSYSIYLFHPVAIILTKQLPLASHGVAGKVIEKILAIVLTMFVSFLIYEYFEKVALRMRPAPLDASGSPSKNS